MQNNLRTFTKAIDDIERKIIEMADITGQELQLAVHSLTDREKNNHCQQNQLFRGPVNGHDGNDRHDDLEGSRLFYDILLSWLAKPTERCI